MTIVPNLEPINVRNYRSLGPHRYRRAVYTDRKLNQMIRAWSVGKSRMQDTMVDGALLNHSFWYSQVSTILSLLEQKIFPFKLVTYWHGFLPLGDVGAKWQLSSGHQKWKCMGKTSSGNFTTAVIFLSCQDGCTWVSKQKLPEHSGKKGQHPRFEKCVGIQSGRVAMPTIDYACLSVRSKWSMDKRIIFASQILLNPLSCCLLYAQHRSERIQRASRGRNESNFLIS